MGECCTARRLHYFYYAYRDIRITFTNCDSTRYTSRC